MYEYVPMNNNIFATLLQDNNLIYLIKISFYCCRFNLCPMIFNNISYIIEEKIYYLSIAVEILLI